MAPKVGIYIPTLFRKFTDNKSRLLVEAGGVEQVLAAVTEKYPALKERVYDNGEPVRHLNVFINGVEIQTLQGFETVLKEGDEVALVPAMAGGDDNNETPLLNRKQMERYSRHTLLSEVGVEGQRKLLDSKILVVGAGGLGSPAGLYLAAAGVGTISFVDGDRVERSNLHRQILHDEEGLGKLKVDTAKERIEKLNPDVRVETHPVILSSENAFSIIEGYDVVVNGCDNFPTRYLLNDACVILGKPLVDAAILQFEGQATVFYPGKGCYRCLFPSPPPPGSVPSCAEAGVIGALSGQMGTLQAMQTI